MIFWSFLRFVFYSVLLFHLVSLIYPQNYYYLDGINNNIKIKKSSGDNKVAIYVINLEHRKDRLENVSKLLNQLPYEWSRVEAVNGLELSPEIISEKVDLKRAYLQTGRPWRKGEVGCSLSHIKAWEEFADSDYDYAIICEDDTFFDPKKLAKAVDVLINKNRMWDIVSFNTIKGWYFLKVAGLIKNHSMVRYCGMGCAADCYIINKKAVKGLLSKALPIRLPLDCYFNREWELDLNFCSVYPNISSQNDKKSDITGEKVKDLYTRKCLYLSTTDHIILRVKQYIFRFQTICMRICNAIHKGICK